MSDSQTASDGLVQIRDQQSVPFAGYTPCDPIEARSGSDVVDPWVRGMYPIVDDGEDGVIQTTVNYVAKQLDDGSGVFMSPQGGAMYAFRTQSGTIVGNESRGLMWPWGSEAEGEVADYISIPFRFAGQLVAEQTDITPDPDAAAQRIGLDSGDSFTEGTALLLETRAVDILSDGHDESGALFSHESGAQFYIGWDSTSYSDSDLFGFVPFDGDSGTPVPTAADALDLLKPFEAAVREDHNVRRQGEWFLVNTGEVPSGSVQKPGVSERPFGGSPFESHIPRDWATGVSDDEFLKAVDDLDAAPSGFETPQAVFDWVHAHDNSHLYAPLRDAAGGLFVRGSLRHRDNEHYMECVDEWHRAETHGWDVLTTDGRQVMAD